MIQIYPADVVLFEGILTFYYPKIRDLFHMKLFVDTDSDTRLARRVPRDINERGRDLDQVLTAYMTFVKPAFEEFCSPVRFIFIYLLLRVTFICNIKFIIFMEIQSANMEQKRENI